MINDWDIGWGGFLQVGQSDSQKCSLGQVEPQMNIQTSWDGAGVSPALNVSYSRRYSAFPQKYPANMQYNCMNTQFSPMGSGEGATVATYSASTYGAETEYMAQHYPVQLAAANVSPLPPPPQPVAKPQPLPSPHPVVSPPQQPPSMPQGVVGYSRRNFPPQGVIPDVTNEQSTYKLDFAKDVWYLENSNNKGKVRTQDLTSGFIASGITKILTEDKKLRCVKLEYVVKNTTYQEIMTAEDYKAERSNKYLKEIERKPKCTRSQFNNLCSYVFQQSEEKELILYSHPGFHDYGVGVVYAANPEDNYIPREMLSKGVTLCKLVPLNDAPEAIIANVKSILAAHKNLRSMGAYRLGSKLLYFLEEAGLNVEQIAIIKPSTKCSEDFLTALLATRDITNKDPVPSVESGEKAVLKENELNWDGICLYADRSFVDEEKKVSTGLKTIVRRNTNGEKGRNLAAVISDKADMIAAKSIPNDFFVINSDGVEVTAPADWVKYVFGEFETLIVSTITSRGAEVKAFFREQVLVFRSKLANVFQGKALDTLVMFYTAEFFFRRFMNISILSDEDLNDVPSLIVCDIEKLLSLDEFQVHDFASILSERIRSAVYEVLQKRNNMRFDDDGKSLLLDGNRLFLSAKIIKDIIVDLKGIRQIETLINALIRLGYLERTDNNTNPVVLHNSEGEYQRLYLYNISIEILDADVIYKLQNLDMEAFLIEKSEIPRDDFLTILNDGNGHFAGKKVCYADEENGHFYITGQSGYGKSYLLCQLLAKGFKLGHRVVAFASSKSFTYEKLCSSLSKSFVDQNVTIYDIDKDGIPINIFGIDRNAGLTVNKKLLLGVLQAGIGELSPPQCNALRKVLSNVITELDDRGRITCDSIITKLNGIDKEFFTAENVKDYLEPLLNELEACNYELSKLNECDRHNCKTIIRRLNGDGKRSGTETLDSLLNSIEPLFEDIEVCRMGDMSWGEFLRNSKNIVVIRTESGNQLVDMLLATLYNYQHDNPQVALDVFLDELQNHNFTKTSPIRKIMKEGRNSHISFFGATQDYYPRNTELGSVMGKAGTQIFLKPSANSESLVLAELRYRKAELYRFDDMERGDIIVKANLFNQKLGRNVPTIISGHVDDFIFDEEDDSGSNS